MDTTAQDIKFNDNGICNYCSNFIDRKNNLTKKENLDELIYKIKKDGKIKDMIVL